MSRGCQRVALAAFVITLIVCAPLRLLLPSRDFAARSVSGSLWQGRITGARIGAVALGDLTVTGAGLARFAFASDAGLHGRFNLWSRRVSGLSGPIDDPALLARLGADQLVLRDVDFAGEPHACRGARGRVQLRLAHDSAGLVAGQSLAGPLICDRGRLTLRLASLSGAEQLELVATRRAGVVARLSVARGDAARDAALRGAGFVESGQRLVRLLPGFD